MEVAEPKAEAETKVEEEPMEEAEAETKPEAEEESKAEAEKEAEEKPTNAEEEVDVEVKTVEKSEVNKDEDDSINIMLGEDEDNLFDDEKKDKDEPSRNLLATLPKTASPPRPETAPVVTPFTSKDTISLASRNNKAPSENSSMRVAVDESESVCTQESLEAAKDDKSQVQSVEQSKNGDDSGSLWVSGLSNTIRAMDLKNKFAEYGKVAGAKVVSSARTPGARCYGYVTMGTVEEALKCVAELNKTELNGKVISVERDKKGSSAPPKASSSSSQRRSSQESKPKDEGAKTDEARTSTSKDDTNDDSKKSGETENADKSKRSPDRHHRGRSREAYSRQRSRDHLGRSRSPIRYPRTPSDRGPSDRGPSDRAPSSSHEGPSGRRPVHERLSAKSPVRDDKPKPGVMTF